jgi:hypothetical protein
MLSSVADAVLLYAEPAWLPRVNAIRTAAVSRASTSIVLRKYSQREAIEWLLMNLGREDIGLVISEHPDATHKLLDAAGMLGAPAGVRLDHAAN